MTIEYIPFLDLLSDIIDNRGRTCPTADTGIPLIATNCIRNDLLFPVFENIRYVSQETYDNWFRGHPKPGDLLFVNKGTPGRVCMVPDPVNFCIAQDMVAIRANQDLIYPKYLFAALRSSEVQTQIENMHVGTLIPHFKKGDFDKLLIPVPDRKSQEIIGDIYFTLSYKIEINRQMNETLEAMARAIFQSWFVDFDPVWAKAEGRQPAGMDTATAALFPSEFEEVEGREVPKGWGVEPLSESFTIIMGQSPPGTTYNENGEGMPFFQGRTDFGFRYPTVRVYCTAPTRFAEAGDSLVSVRAPVGDINLAQEKCCVGRGVAAVRHKTGSRSFTYYQMLSFKDIFALFESEGTVFGSIAKTDFNSIECITPPNEIVKKFEQIVFPIDQMIENNEQQSRTLAQLRDTLLPKLMSGEIQVGEIK